MTETDDEPLCISCDEPFAAARAAAGYDTCLKCGERAAIKARQRWTVAPMHKSNYQLITDRTLLTGINNKGGLAK